MKIETKVSIQLKSYHENSGNKFKWRKRRKGQLAPSLSSSEPEKETIDERKEVEFKFEHLFKG